MLYTPEQIAEAHVQLETAYMESAGSSGNLFVAMSEEEHTRLCSMLEQAVAQARELAELRQRVDHVLSDIDACQEADHCKYFGEWLRRTP